jgi:hypothetical protein
MGDMPAVYEGNPDTFDVAVWDDAPQFGDESLSIGHGETLDSGGALDYDRIVARVGNIGINIGFRGTMLPQGIAEQVIEEQIACIEDGECDGTVPVPATLTGEAGAMSSATSGDETPTSRADDHATYTSDLYPLAPSYGDE